MYKNFTRILSISCSDSLQPCVSPFLRGSVFCSNRGRINSIGYVFKRTKKNDRGPSALFVPVPVKPNPDDMNVGEEFTGRLKKQDLLKILNKFYQKPEVRVLASENGLDDQLLHQAFLSFRRHCLEHDLPPDLHITISDILQGIHLQFRHQIVLSEAYKILRYSNLLQGPAMWMIFSHISLDMLD